jgi:hypothetical protein
VIAIELLALIADAVAQPIEDRIAPDVLLQEAVAGKEAVLRREIDVGAEVAREGSATDRGR